MNKIILIGFATCYKTTVGRLLASKLGYKLVDTDEQLQRRLGQSVAQILDTHGEAYFREQESELVRNLTSDLLVAPEDVVIACGGGTVLSPNFGDLARDGTVVHLTASAETVYSRLDGVSRPLFDKLSVEQLRNFMVERAPLYAKYAKVTVSTDGKTPEQVAELILSNVN